MFDRNKFKAQIILAGFTAKEVAEKMGMPEPTFYRKINKNGNFKREEIAKLIDLLDIKDPSEIFFAK